jgi:two-component system sensor histidine kinase ChiS
MQEFLERDKDSTTTKTSAVTSSDELALHTVLIVEDNDLLRNLYRDVLMMEGYRVLAATTLSEGRALLDTSRPNLVLMDVKLSDGSGLDLCRELRGELQSKIPVLIVSSYCSKKDISAGYAAGCNDYLVKPFLNDELVARVKALIK